MKIFILSLFMITHVLASEKAINEDGTAFESPRLAGDSLPIKPKVSVLKNINAVKVKGLLRYSAQVRDSNLHQTQDSSTSPSNDTTLQQYSTLGGYLGIESPSVFYTSVGATLYTAHPVGPNPDDRLGLGGANEEGGTANSYTVLGEAFVKVQDEKNRLVLGRQEMPDYRFISLSNIRMTPFTHEGLTYENTFFKDVQVNLAYIGRQKDRNAETFEDMVRAARVKTGNTDGTGKKIIRGDYSDLDFGNGSGSGSFTGEDKAMYMGGLTYKSKHIKAEVWDYYVNDFVNTLYLYAAYTFMMDEDIGLTFATQYANQNDVGQHVAGSIDTWFYGLKAQLSFNKGMTFFTAYNEVSYNEESYDGGSIFVRWGTPQMFNSFQVQDSELAGTKSLGLGAQFELGKMKILDNTVIRFRYAYYDMPDETSQLDARQDRQEATFDLRYSFTKNDGFGIFTQMDGLSLQFRIAYDKYKTDYDYAAFKLEHGYEFNEVTKNFVDTRLYVDYVF